MNHNITIEGGKTKRLKTAGKYCDRDIVVAATGGGAPDNRFVEMAEDNLPVINDTVLTKLRPYAFYNLDSLTKAKFEYVTSVGSYSFSGCSSLEMIELPSLNSAFSSYTFNGCTSLKNVKPINTTLSNCLK